MVHLRNRLYGVDAPEYKHRKRSYHQYRLLLTNCVNYWRETSKAQVSSEIYNQSNNQVLLQSETYKVSKRDNNISSIDLNKIVNTHANIVWLKLPFAVASCHAFRHRHQVSCSYACLSVTKQYNLVT